MTKERDGKEKSGKKKAVKNLKEKREAKEAKRHDKSNQGITLFKSVVSNPVTKT